MIDEKLKLTGGIYHANASYVGSGDNFGWMVGYEVSVTDKFHLMGDWTFGDNYIGVGVLGGLYDITPSIPLSFGLQIPNNTDKTSYGLVFEFTYVPH